MAVSSLQAIRDKVRKLTRSLTQATLTNAELDQYINTYVLYDFPETLRLFNLRSTFSFYTSPFVDVYSTTDISSPLYNFTNKYIITDSPIYIGGFQAQYYQSRNQFFGIYPFVNSIASIGQTGNDVLTSFSGVINSQQANVPSGATQQICLLKSNVLFSSVDIYGNGVAMQDTPILDSSTGLPTIYGSLYNALAYDTQPYNINTNTNGYPVISCPAPYTDSALFPTTNFINYVTGEFYVTFSTPPASGIMVNSQTVPVNPALPQSLLFYDGQFTVRPVPDQPYRIDMEVFIQPTELLSADQTPELSEWWQLIAFNAAKKVLEDRLDYDSINLFIPSLKEQERLVLRRTIVQQTTQRSATIYTEDTAGAYGSGWFNGGGQF